MQLCTHPKELKKWWPQQKDSCPSAACRFQDRMTRQQEIQSQPVNFSRFTPPLLPPPLLHGRGTMVIHLCFSFALKTPCWGCCKYAGKFKGTSHTHILKEIYVAPLLAITNFTGVFSVSKGMSVLEGRLLVKTKSIRKLWNGKQEQGAEKRSNFKLKSFAC